MGLRIYNKKMKVIFTTGFLIENNNIRDNTNENQLVKFELYEGERIIGIRSYDNGSGFSTHRNV